MDSGLRKSVKAGSCHLRAHSIGTLDSKEAVVQADFDFGCVFGRHPVNHAFDFSAFWIFAQGVMVDAAFEFNHIACRVFYYFIALDHIAVAQAYFTSRGQAFEAFGRIFGKVVCLDVDGLGYGDFTLAHFFVIGVERGTAALGFAGFKVSQGYFERIQDCQSGAGRSFPVLHESRLPHAHVDDVFGFGNTGAFGKQAQTFGRITTAAHTGNRRHTRIIPACNVAV